MKVYQSDLLNKPDNIKHGFFSKRGGVSEGIYASLNVGRGSDDKDIHIEENRLLVKQWFNPNSKLATLHQIHSNKVVTITDGYDANNAVEADAMVTNHANIVLGILTADCVPVLFADHENGIIGAAHAGWKGAYGGIIHETIEHMRMLGAAHIEASIGPCIHQSSYEVDTKFKENICEQDEAFEELFNYSDRSGHFLFDLPGYVQHQLEDVGVTFDQIPVDTYMSEKDCFSYRRSCHMQEPDYGRQISGIMLK